MKKQSLINIVLVSLGAASALLAGEPVMEATPGEGLLPIPDYSGSWAERTHLSGDWGGVRQRWAEKGIMMGVDLSQSYQGVVNGGVDEMSEAMTNIDYRMTLDLMRMDLVPGGLITVRGQSRFGRSVNGASGLLLPVNMYGAFPMTAHTDEDLAFALTELNWTQFLSDEFGFLLGKITTLGTTNEFIGGQGRTQFSNFQFNFSATVAQVAPYSTLAGSLFWMPNENWTLTTTLMNLTDSSIGSGFDDIGDGATWATTLDYRASLNSLPGGGSFGYYYSFNADLAKLGGLNIDPGTGVASISTDSEGWALSWSGWQYLWSEENSSAVDPANGIQDLQGVGVFMMAGIGDGKTNPVHWSIAAGFSGKGTLPGRDDDSWGAGYFYNDLESLELSSVLSLDDSTSGVELYYSVKLAASTDITLNAQWSNSAFKGVDDAFILGARWNMSF